MAVSQNCGQAESQHGREAAEAVSRGRVALVLLAEAHVAVPVALRHAGVIHHEEVHVKVVCARSSNLIVF